jgi:hypothetical protein
MIWHASMIRLWPDTLVGRTIVVVLVGVALSNLIALADRILGAEEPNAATGSCCGGAKATSEKASSCC